MRISEFIEHQVDVEGEGLGLGLYITKEIATAHGGTVDLKSDLEGTAFTVRLPRTPPVAANRRARTVGQRDPSIE